MARLIDADKLKTHYAWWKGGTRTMTMDEAKSDFDVMVDLQPTVANIDLTMVGITYCKDCKWYSQVNIGMCNKYEIAFKPDDYCSCGEREDDGKVD